jgi:hypothetical protein
LFQILETELSGRVQPSTERHAWIELDDDVSASSNVLLPGWLDYDALTDAMYLVVLAPSVGPILFGEPLGLELTDAPQPSQMPEGVCNVAFDGLGVFVNRDVGLDDDWSLVVNRVAVPSDFGYDRLLDYYSAAVGVSSEELTYCLDGFAIDSGAQF